MRRITYLFGTLVAVGLLALGCDSVTEPATDDSTPASTATGVTSPSIEGDVVTITEEDLGPSERPDGYESGDYDVPEEDWFTPTHDDPLNTAGATYGFFGAPDHEDTFGEGSFLFDVPAGERSWILTDKYGTGEWHGEPDAKDGTRLEDINTLAYSTFISEEFPDPEDGTQGADVVPSLQIMALDGDGGWLPLVFDPPSDDAVTGEWQRWDATGDHAGWRRDGDFPKEGWTWNEVITDEYPDAVILWAIGIAAGTWPNKDFNGYADLLTVGVDGEGTTTYNFQPLTKSICKDGGWEDYGFKNQGQCIRYVNTEEDSR